MALDIDFIAEVPHHHGMEWIDEAIILSARPHGETSAVVTLITAQQGRHAGLVAGGQGRTRQPVLQPGNIVTAQWRARMADHLGHFVLDLDQSPASFWLDDPRILALIASAMAVTEASLPERQPMPGVYAGLKALLTIRDPDLWGAAYVQWEIGLLRALGYGLDLSNCAAGGDPTDLTYISPRTGRAVSREAGLPYHDKLFHLPSFLLGSGDIDDASIAQGLDITGHFLSRHVFCNPHSRLLIKQDGDLPAARQRLSELYAAPDPIPTAKYGHIQ